MDAADGTVVLLIPFLTTIPIPSFFRHLLYESRSITNITVDSLDPFDIDAGLFDADPDVYFSSFYESRFNTNNTVVHPSFKFDHFDISRRRILLLQNSLTKDWMRHSEASIREGLSICHAIAPCHHSRYDTSIHYWW